MEPTRARRRGVADGEEPTTPSIFEEEAAAGTEKRRRSTLCRTCIYIWHSVNIKELLQPKGKLFLVDGLSNYRFKKGKKWIYPFDLDSIEDRPWNAAKTWQHVIGINDGKIMRNYIQH